MGFTFAENDIVIEKLEKSYPHNWVFSPLIQYKTPSGGAYHHHRITKDWRICKVFT
jgi:hypothetical protein